MGNILDIFTYSPESPMLFSSSDFLLLFLPFFAIFTVVSRKMTWRNLYPVSYTHLTLPTICSV